MSENKVNKFLSIIIVVSIIFSMIGISIKEVNALEDNLDTKEYTRKEMQEMVVSTALSLYYNDYFSDYGQRAMDNLSVPGNYFNYGNFLWRDLNISPESVGYSKYYHIDCSGYNFLIYKNTIGYDMSQYNTVNRYLLFNKEYERDGETYPVRRVSAFSGEKRLLKYREAYTKFGYGWNSGFLANVFRSAAGNCGNDNCTKLNESTSTSPFIYNNIDGHDENEIVYFFEARQPVSLATVKSKYAIAEAALQPGDIIVYTKYDKSEDDESGHVMFYAGEDITTSSKNETGFTDLLLHSTGNGGGDYTDDPTSVNNKLYKKTSIISSSAANYIDGTYGRFEKAYGSTVDGSEDYIIRFGIIRPLNTVCEKGTNNKYDQTDICKISNNTYNVPLTKTQLNNNEARVALKKTQVQQYMIVEKEYNNQKKVTSSTKDGYTRNIISEYNSVNVGDKVIYKLRLRNKFNQTSVSNIRLEAIIPDNATYVSNSCSDNCTKEGNKLIWTNISISGENTLNDITFSIKPQAEGTMIFSGYTVIKDNKTLQLDPRTINVMPTQNGINKEILRETVNKFQTLVENGQINYIGSGTHEENITNLDELLNDSSKTATISTLGYVKNIYYNAFGLDLDTLIGTESVLNSTKIKNAIFEEVAYPEKNNFITGSPIIPEEEKTPTVFAKKTAEDYNDLTNIQKKISQMLVPGLYGGRHLKGNDNNDRVKFLRSFYNNQAYQSDLEVGDIIIYYTSDSSSIRAFLYLGDDGENGTILTRFTISTSDKPLFLYHTDQYLDTYYSDTELQKKTKNKPSSQILNELFAKDLFVVLRPSRLGTTVEYNYNGGIAGPKSYVAYTKYHNLVTPTKTDKNLTLKSSRDNAVDKTYTGTSKFNCWTTDSELKNCITNSTKITSTDYQKIYAKWDSTIITLPTLTSKGYTHTGWGNNDKTLAANESYAIEKNETLNAIWEANKYTIKYNANGGTGTVSQQEATYDTNITIRKNNYIKTGYTFTGWNTKADGTGTAYTENESTKNLATSGTITLYAQWKANTYTIKFDNNTGTGTLESVTYTYDVSSTLPASPFTKENYTFTGWNTKQDGSGTSYVNNATIKNLVPSGEVTLYAQWKANTYTIKYNSNTGTGTMANQTTSYDKETTIKTNAFTKTGYTFIGWNTASNGTGTKYTEGQIVKNLVSSGTITLYAQWEANKYTVKFDNNNGTGTMSNQTLTYNKSERLIENTFTKEGYAFTEWNTKQDGSGTSYLNNASVKNLATSGEITLYAQWKANEYIIKYNSNTGTGTMSNQTTSYDKEITLAENTFTKEGYTFVGWNTKPDGTGTKYSNKATVKNLISSGEIILYAEWKVSEYVVKFNSNSGTGTMSNQTITYDKETNLTQNKFQKIGYSFVSWNTKPDGTGTSYTDKALVKNLIKSGEITLYAQWKANEYIIKYNSNTGTGTMSNQTASYDKEITLVENTFTKEGYTFIGWNTKADGTGTKYSNKSTVKNLISSGEIILYAEWKANTYEIIFNNTTGEGTMPVQSATYDKNVILNQNKFTKTGYTFAGWNTKSDGTGTTYTDGQTVKNLTSAETITLYAMWTINKYTIIFDSNGGQGTMANLEMTYNEEKILPENLYTRENYKFISWNTKSDGTGKTYTDKQIVSNVVSKGTITLYAIWKTTLNYNIKEYQVDSQNNFIDNIPIETTLEDYLKNIEVGDEYRVEVNLGDKKSIPTGSTTKIYKDDKVVIEFINIVRGDVNKDGSISALDYVKVKNHIMKTSPISDKDILLAADANSDNNISALDYVRIKNIILSKQK